MNDTLRYLIASGQELYARRDFAQARHVLEQIVERDQSLADVYNMLGVIYHDGGLFSKAQDALERALLLNHHYTEAALNLAVLYNDLGKYNEARETYNRALADCDAASDGIDPFVAGKIANMHAEVAEAYRHAGKLDPSLQEYDKALRLRPAFADIRVRMAMALMEVKQFAVAAQELRRALKDRPEYLPARVHLGICCYCMGQREEAVQHWHAVLQQDPGNSSTAMYLRMAHAASDGAQEALDNA